MPAFLRIEIFPSDLKRTIDFYTNVLRFTLLRHEDSYAYFRRDDIFIGADATHPEGSLIVDAKFRRPSTGVEVVIEVDDIQAERDHVVEKGHPLDADLKLQFWNLTDFRVVDPDGYYLRITEHGKEKSGAGF